MDFDFYQAATRETAVYPESGSGSYNAFQYLGLGLTSEAGEVAGKLKKAYRDDAATLSEERLIALVAEVGDVLWYAARLADEAQLSLSDVAQANIEKLFDRKDRGVIGGSGDNR